MNYLFTVSLTLVAAYILVLLSVTVWLLLRKRKIKVLQEYSKISILVAARNEENNILECLQKLNALDYPKELLDIIIGNDHSEDNTLSIIEDYIKDKPHFSVLNIEKNLGKAKGKANVLAQLAHQAKGDYFFITDADIRVPAKWIQALLPLIQEGKYIVSGTSIVRANKGWNIIQEWDWLFLYLLNSFMQEIKPITCSGNNMALSAAAYRESGGYENIDFSVTEDYELYRVLKKKGYTHIQLFEKNATAWSAPVEQFTDLLNQRRRWIKGGKGLPFHFWFLMSIYSVFYPALIILLFTSPITALILLGARIVPEAIMLAIAAGQIGMPLRWSTFLFYEISIPFIGFVNAWHLLKPGKVKWKGREF